MWLDVLFHFPILGLSVSPSFGALQPTTTWKACLCEATSLPNPLDAYWTQLFHVSTGCPLYIQVEAFSSWSPGARHDVWRPRSHEGPRGFFYLAACAAGDLAHRCCRCVTLQWGRLTCHIQTPVSSISSVSTIGIPAWWDVKSSRHRVSTSEQVRELELTLVIIFGAVMFLKGTTVAIRNYRNPFINPWRGF